MIRGLAHGATVTRATEGRPAGPRVPLGHDLWSPVGDKGGNANIGLWTRTDVEYAWLRGFLTVERTRELLGPEVADLAIDVWPLPNLRALNVVVHGILGAGVASSTRSDPQAKGLGEYLRSWAVEVPVGLI